MEVSITSMQAGPNIFTENNQACMLEISLQISYTRTEYNRVLYEYAEVQSQEMGVDTIVLCLQPRIIMKYNWVFRLK